MTRLRKRHANEGWIDDLNVELDAADEIERLRLELEEQQYWNSVLQEQVKYTI